ncbi:MAG: hypothetical protein ABIJ97_10140, partial [Bacteroidota bacterium]
MKKAGMDHQITEHAKGDLNPVIVVLSNGLRVTNFSSPHSFKFTDDSVLPAVSDELSKALSMKCVEKIIPGIEHTISVNFELTDELSMAINYWMNEYKNKNIDIVIVPEPLLYVLKKTLYYISCSPFRTIRFNKMSKLAC